MLVKHFILMFKVINYEIGRLYLIFILFCAVWIFGKKYETEKYHQILYGFLLRLQFYSFTLKYSIQRETYVSDRNVDQKLAICFTYRI